MKRMMAILLAVSILLGLSACGGGLKESYMGTYRAYSGEMFGITMTADELFGGEDKFTLELRSSEKVTVDAQGEKLKGKYTLSDESITIEVDNLTMSGRLIDNMLFVDNVLGMEGLKIIFYKEGTTPTMTPGASAGEESAGAVETPMTIEEAPESGETASEPVADVGVLGNYYGFAYHSNANQDFSLRFEDKVPIWAYLGSDAEGDNFFEIYKEEDRNTDSVIASMWVMIFDNKMVPFIGEENAWIYDVYLTEADTTPMTVEIVDDTLIMHYSYHKIDGEVEYSADVTFYLLKEGTPWIEPSF
ncbi:MAG: hypothetical protein GX260_04190 [Tissierellia bacterium]|nr:hypothetical protein [Bacillota bacterium]NLL22963.1 hypothetical protein [Tissierellia bacterium]